MNRATAGLLLVTMGACVAAPVVEDDKANLASVAPVAPPSPKVDTAPLLAVACTNALPCVYSDGVWQPQALAAQTAGWGAGLAECKAKLGTCDRVGADTVSFVVIGILSGVAGAAAAIGAYELRDWLRR